MSKRKHDEATGSSQGQKDDTPLFESTPIHDRASIFIAIFSPSTTEPRKLQRHPSFESAMHRILAWRKPSAQKSLAGSFGAGSQQRVMYETSSDEDGEKYAGKKLEKLLDGMGAVGTVVVARWYGGVLLGPVRFKWIEDAAREAILKWKASTGTGSISDHATGQAGDVKKVKLDESSQQDEGKEKGRLVRMLTERDGSISVLRALLAEKKAELNVKKEVVDAESKEAPSGSTQNEESLKSPSKAAPDYNSMPVERLKQLGKARDATLSWILKQIDAVEQKLKTKGEEKG